MLRRSRNCRKVNDFQVRLTILEGAAVLSQKLLCAQDTGIFGFSRVVEIKDDGKARASVRTADW